MKRIFVCLLAAVLLLACAGCGAKKSEESVEEKTLTGTLDEVKDFNGDSYALTCEGNAPEGLSEREVGDRVTVTYTGELSVVDAFTGQVLSVEAAE